MFEPISNNEKIEQIKLIRDLLERIEEITEFSESELKAISILESDEYLSSLLSFYKINKKHVKRKHSSELLEALKAIAKSMQELVVGGINK